MKKQGIPEEGRRNTRAQSPVSPIARMTGKVVVKGLGFVIFVIGAFIILSAYLGTPVVGQVIKGNSFAPIAAVLGLALEVIGLVLMVLRIGPDYNKYELQKKAIIAKESEKNSDNSK